MLLEAGADPNIETAGAAATHCALLSPRASHTHSPASPAPAAPAPSYTPPTAGMDFGWIPFFNLLPNLYFLYKMWK